MTPGRPTVYTQEIADLICERIAGGESLRTICGELGLAASTVIRWAVDDVQGFSEQYARARDAQADTLFDEIVRIADEDPGTLDNGATDSGMVADKRLRVDARKWVASKLAPKKYGEKTAMELTGKDGGPIEVDAGQASERIAKFMALAQARKAAKGNEPDVVDTSDLI